MKKLVTLTVIAAFALFGTAFAQIGVSSSTTGSVAADHPVKVNVPSVVALKLVGSVDGAVTFDVSEADVLAAAAATTTLAPTSRLLDEVQVFTNDKDGVTVTVGVAAAVTNPGGLPTSAILINGASASGFSWSTPAKTGGFATVLDFDGGIDSFGLEIDGDEEDGSYDFTVTYTAAAL